ncbi:MAG: hypothetical protein H6661_08440 [Ardenticatenaceae bacterium]|nr:hypothetical protein [Ardenticatenaceae bacterium]
MNTMNTQTYKFWIGVLAPRRGFGVAHAAHARGAPDVTFDLCATIGTLCAKPGGVTVLIWGYALGDCSGSPSASLPSHSP